MRVAATVARYLTGLLLFVFGLNGFLNVIPQPAPPPAGGEFMGALVAGNVLPVVKAFEVVIGALLLAGRFVPLALIMLVPIAVGVVLYHLSFDMAGGAGAYVLGALTAFLLWAYRSHLMPLLVSKATPLAERATA